MTEAAPGDTGTSAIAIRVTMNQQVPPDAVRHAWRLNGNRARAKQRTYEQLLHAARAIFDERGYEAATVRDVAQAVGMSTGAVFANFADKAALFIDVVNDDCQQLNALMAAADLSGLSTEEAILRLLDIAQRHHADHLGLIQTAIGFAWRGDVGSNRHKLLGLHLIKQRLTGLLARGVETGQLAFYVNVPLLTDMLLDTYLASYKTQRFGGLGRAEIEARQVAQVKMLIAGAAKAA
jgi:AcrR family transcriptional regulator